MMTRHLNGNGPVRMPFLGCIADDFTGATDLAGLLVRAGMRTVQMIGVPEVPPPEADALVVALKSRTVAPAIAVEQSLAALEWLSKADCRRFYFKYCSTFDSTDTGNIGPVADALLRALDVPFTIACPAFPENGRTVFKGHLFVGDVLLSESGMRDHPLTPMQDANLVRVLQRQTQRKIGRIDHAVVGTDSEQIRRQIAQLQRRGVEIAIVDATSDAELTRIGEACADLLLVTAGSGLVLGLVPAWRARGLLGGSAAADAPPRAAGLRAVIAGSASVATREQVVAAQQAGMPAFQVNPLRLAAGEDVVGAALAWAEPLLRRGAVLIYSTASPDSVRAVQDRLGRERSGALVEQALAAVARGLVDQGVGQLIVAGGETAGAVVSALGVKYLRIGPEIAPGVPWTSTPGSAPLALALKSGNFGGRDMFLDAWSKLR
jgi:3-dehydrotetronate 4-kinase